MTLKVRSVATELVKKREGKKKQQRSCCVFSSKCIATQKKNTHIYKILFVHSWCVAQKGGTKRRAHQHTVSIAGARNHQAQTKNHTAAQRCACADMVACGAAETHASKIAGARRHGPRAPSHRTTYVPVGAAGAARHMGNGRPLGPVFSIARRRNRNAQELAVGVKQHAVSRRRRTGPISAV